MPFREVVEKPKQEPKPVVKEVIVKQPPQDFTALTKIITDNNAKLMQIFASMNESLVADGQARIMELQQETSKQVAELLSAILMQQKKVIVHTIERDNNGRITKMQMDVKPS